MRVGVAPDCTEVVAANRLVHELERAAVRRDKRRRFAATLLQKVMRGRFGKAVFQNMKEDQRQAVLAAERQRLAIAEMLAKRSESAMAMQALFRGSRDRARVNTIQAGNAAEAEQQRFTATQRLRLAFRKQRRVREGAAALRVPVLLFLAGAAHGVFTGVHLAGGLETLRDNLRRLICTGEEEGVPKRVVGEGRGGASYWPCLPPSIRRRRSS